MRAAISPVLRAVSARPAPRALIALALSLACAGACLPAQAQIRLPLAEVRVVAGAVPEADWLPEAEGAPCRPLALDVHPSGAVWGISAERRRLFSAASVGAPVRFAGGAGSGRPGLADRLFARSGLKVFSLDSWEGVVERFDLGGAREARLDLRALCAAARVELIRTTDFCLGPSGELFVLDGDRRRVLAFGDRGEYRRALGESDEVRLRAPVAIDVDGHGRLHLLEAEGPALVRIDVDGQLSRRAIALAGEKPMRADLLAVDAWGNAFVAERAGGRVLAVASTADSVWWLPGSPVAGRIEDLAVDPTGRLLVVDGESARVRVLRLLYRPEGAAPDGVSRGR